MTLTRCKAISKTNKFIHIHYFIHKHLQDITTCNGHLDDGLFGL
jgi:hypothetical protein